MEGSKNNTWLWVALVVVAALALGVAYYYYYYGYTSVPSDTTAGSVSTEDELASELNAFELDDLESEIGDIEKELQ